MFNVRNRAAVFLLLFAAACGTPETEQREAELIAAGVVSTGPDGGACAPSGIVACNADRSATYACSFGWPIGHPGGWTGRVACQAPGYCISDTVDGHQKDYCGDCVPGVSYCDGAQHTCDIQGHWVNGGSCTPKCPCGGLYPRCMLCQ